jgi:hypothetical protein
MFLPFYTMFINESLKYSALIFCYIINKSMIKKQISISTIFLIVVIILYVLVLLLQPKRYYMWYPTLPIYPDNSKGIDFMVKEYISKEHKMI